MFWKRMTAWAGFWGMISGIVTAAGVWAAAIVNDDLFRSSFQQAMWMGIAAAVMDLVVSIGVSAVTTPKPESELVGLVKGMEIRDAVADAEPVRWYKQPILLGAGAITLSLAMYIPFALL
jgi:SSS family solute:Na+ symporter